jgi:hypothetical protein
MGLAQDLYLMNFLIFFMKSYGSIIKNLIIFFLTVTSSIVLIIVLLHKKKKKVKTIVFFHPCFCQGGGGERVLWAYVKCLLEPSSVQQDPNVKVVILSGDDVQNSETVFKLIEV